jgi:hypothetical protein
VSSFALAVATVAAKYKFEGITAAETQVVMVGAGILGALLTVAIVFVGKMFGVPADIHSEQSTEIKALTKTVAEMAARSVPKIEITGVEPDRSGPDQRYDLCFKNLSDDTAIPDCLARIEEIIEENGTQYLRHQDIGGRFDLDPGQSKRLGLFGVAGTPSAHFRLLATGKKLPAGNYTMRVRLSSTSGGQPVEVKIAIKGAAIFLEEQGRS